jgi:hypothetical protein
LQTNSTLSYFAFAIQTEQSGGLTAEAQEPEVLTWPSDVAPEQPPDSAMVYRSSQESGSGSSEPRKHVQPYEQTKLAAAAQLRAQLQAEQQKQAEELAKRGPPCVRARPRCERVYVARRQEPVLNAAAKRWGAIRGVARDEKAAAAVVVPAAAAAAPAAAAAAAAAAVAPAAAAAAAPAADDATKQLQQYDVALHASKLLTDFNQWQQHLPETTGVATSVRTVCYYLTKWGRYYWRQQRQTCPGLQAVDYLVEQLSEVIAAADAAAERKGKSRADLVPDSVLLDAWRKRIDTKSAAAEAELRKVTRYCCYTPML